MKQLRIALSLASTLLAGAGWANLKIVTTTADLASIAAAVGGRNVSVSSFITGSRDAHRLEAKPSYMSRTAGANVFIAIGMDLEVGYEKAILNGSGNAKVAIGAPGHIYASEFVHVLEKPSGPVSRAHGDIHPYGNPHVWLDPYNGRLVALGLKARFSKLDRANAANYEANCAAFVKRLDTAMFGAAAVAKHGGDRLWAWSNDNTLASKVGSSLGGWAAKMAPLAGTPIITYHRSWSYLARRFRLNVVDELEPKPGLEPTPGHLASIIRTVGSQKVKAILQEPFFSTRHAKLVASRTSAKVIVLPQNVGQVSGAGDYIGLFDTIVGTLVQGLR